MNKNELALKKANEAINKAKESIHSKRNETDRKFILAGIGRDLVKILVPLLQQISTNSRLNKQDLTDVISNIKVEAPKVDVSAPKVSVQPTKVDVPKIEFPKEELIKAIKTAIKGIKFPETKVDMPSFPKEMKVAKIQEVIKGIKKLADAKMTVSFSDVYDRDNPLPVILTDEKGIFYKAISNLISSGGAGVGIGSLNQNNGRLQIDISPGTYKLADTTHHVKKYFTGVGATNDGIIWSPATDRRWYVTDIFIGISAAATVTLEDDLAGGDSPLWKMELAANSGWSHSFQTPLYSGEDGADLTITTSAGTVYVTVTGYEV